MALESLAAWKETDNMQWYYWVIVIVCSLFSMFFSAADMVYGMVDKDRLNREKGKREKRAKLAIRIADDYELSISAILLGNNIVNVLALLLWP